MSQSTIEPAASASSASSKSTETAEEPVKPTETRNISSSDIENEEVANIAQELKQSLGKTEKPSETSVSVNAKLETTETETPQEPALDEDTIYIDRDGTLHNKNEPAS